LRCFKESGSCRTAFLKISTIAREKKLGEAMVLGWWFSPWLDRESSSERESGSFSSQGAAKVEKNGPQLDVIAWGWFRVAWWPCAWQAEFERRAINGFSTAPRGELSPAVRKNTFLCRRIGLLLKTRYLQRFPKACVLSMKEE
jgi:hypothetical protein